MQGSGETWDVFVVGVRDSSHASTVMLAAELAHYTGMPTSEVELALMKGDVRVRAGLDRNAAENAAMELDDIGAIVDLRLSDGKSGIFSILKPDAKRRSGVAVGGFIDDSATPPEVAEISDLEGLPLEPDSESLPPPPPPMGRPIETLEDIASEPIVINPHDSGNAGDILQAVSGLEQQGADALGHVDDHTVNGDKAVVDIPLSRRPDSVPPLMNRASAAPEWINEPPTAGSRPPTGSFPAQGGRLPTGSHPAVSGRPPTGSFPAQTGRPPTGSFPAQAGRPPTGSFPAQTGRPPTGSFPAQSGRPPTGSFPAAPAAGPVPSGAYPVAPGYGPPPGYPGGPPPGYPVAPGYGPPPGYPGGPPPPGYGQAMPMYPPGTPPPGYAPAPAYAPPTGAPPMAAPVPMAAPEASVPPPAQPSLAPTPSPSASQSASLVAGLDALEITDLPNAPKAKAKKKKKKAALEPEPPMPEAVTKAASMGPKPSDSLELDFEAVGVLPKKRKLRELGGRISGPHRAVEAEPPRRTRADNIAGSGGSAYGRQEGDDEAVFILGSDRLVALPLGLALGLIISLMVAIQFQRGADQEILGPLENELMTAASHPRSVTSGEVRPPNQVEAELAEEYAALKRGFLIKWLAFGLPLGFGLSRIRRLGR